MSLPYGLDLNNQINVDKTATRISVTLRDLTTSEMLDFEARSMAWLKANAPQSQAIAASTTLMFAHIGERNISGILSSMLITAGIVSLFLIVALRSWRLGLLSLIPNILPVAMAFGIWGLTVGQLGFSVAIVAAITLGIVVDDTVHFISVVQDGIRHHQMAVRAAVIHAFRTTGSALLATTLILVSGFLVLGASTFALNHEMGVMTAITLALGLVTDFLLLPALIIKLLEKKHATQKIDLAADSVLGN
jgi:predicted RND superfamily exporter protein